MIMPFLAMWAIARGTLLESIRNRLLLVSLFFALVLIALSVAAASVSLGEQARLITDVGLAAQSGVGTIIAVALSISSFAGEITRRTAYPVLARPISRTSFVVGKFIGLWLAATLVSLSMVLATALVVALYGGPVSQGVWVSIPLSIAEMAVAVAVSLLFSAISGPILAAAFSASVLLAGNLVSSIGELASHMAAEHANGVWLFRGFYFLLPDVEKMSVRVQAANQLAIPPAYWIDGLLYGLLYTLCTLTLAGWIFSQRRAV